MFFSNFHRNFLLAGMDALNGAKLLDRGERKANFPGGMIFFQAAWWGVKKKVFT